MRRSPFRRSALPAVAPAPFGERRRVVRTRVPWHRRLVAARTALAYWVAVVLLCLVTGTVVSRLVARAAAAERRFGVTRSVLVTRRALHAGERVTNVVTRREERPIAQLPAGALRTIPPRASVSGPVARGEVLTAARLERRGTGAPTGTVAIAVPVGDASVLLRPGDRVDVYATYDPTLTPPGTPPTSRVGHGAEVIRTGRRSVTIAARAAEVEALVAAVARSTITVTLER